VDVLGLLRWPLHAVDTIARAALQALGELVEIPWVCRWF
jgi:hypothetical protein